MKKAVKILICLLTVLSLLGCTSTIDGVKTHTVKSTIFTQEEITEAKTIAIDQFHSIFPHSELLEIYYAGDELAADSKATAYYYGGDECMVLYSSFIVAEEDAIVLTPNKKYDQYAWVFVTKDGKMELVTNGFN